MKNRKRMLSLLLAACMSVSCFTGCTQETSTEVQETKQNVKQTIAETELDFIKDGTSEYAIVCPAEPSENETFAAEELQYFIKGASGAELPILLESSDMAEGKYFYVGETEAAKAAGVVPTYEEVKYNGFVLQQKEDDVYLKGYSDLGTRNAVYEFLYYAFDYEFYAADEIRLTETKDAKMLAYDLTVMPEFDWREGNYGEIIYNPVISHRMRFNETEEIFVTGHVTHNSMKIIDPTVYDWQSDEYKDWYSEAMATDPLDSAGGVRPAQLCYSNDAMREEYTKNLIELIQTSDAPNMLMGMEDNYDWCTCEKCSANKEKYGTDAVTMIWFINKVQADVDAWFAENRPGEEPVHLVMFAYYSTVKPPAEYDAESKEYKPMDDTVVLNEHSGVMFAPIGAEYDVPFDSAEASDVSNTHGQILGWASLAENLYAWTYSLFPNNGLLFFDTIEVMQQNYGLLSENGTTMLLDQTDMYQKNVNSGFSRLKAYVMSKLQWDNSLNMNELIDDFFDNYFDAAADTMQELFNQEREWLTHVYADLGAAGYIGDNLLDSNYWTFHQLQGYMDKIEQAYADIESIRETDPERYSVLYDRILLESMQFRYLILSIYYTEYSEAELLEMRQEFRYDFERLGLTSYRENGDISELWSEWGIK